MPTQDRVGLHQQDRPVVASEHASQRGEDRSVLGFEARRRKLALQDAELMAQHEDLDILGTIPAAAQHQQVDHEPDETIETCQAPILIDPSRADQIEARNPRSTVRTRFRHPQVVACLQAALRLEVFEHTHMYPGFARTARDEGFDEVTVWFETLIRSERSHAQHLARAIETLTADTLG